MPARVFHDDRMFPVVAEVVGVDEAGDARFEQAIQGQAIFVGDVVNGVAIAVLPAADVEGMEMAIMPAHGGLDRLMQITRRRLARHEEAAPDRRSRAAQRHLQAEDALAGTSLRLDGPAHDPRTLSLGRLAITVFCATVCPTASGLWSGSGRSSRVRRID